MVIMPPETLSVLKKNAIYGTFKINDGRKMWFKRTKNPPGSQTNTLTGGKEMYECTIQCEVKNILYAFLSSCVHFSVLLLLFFSCCFFFVFFFNLAKHKKLKQCVQCRQREVCSSSEQRD